MILNENTLEKYITTLTKNLRAYRGKSYRKAADEIDELYERGECCNFECLRDILIANGLSTDLNKFIKGIGVSNMELRESHAQGTCPICGEKIYSDEGCVKVAGVNGYVHDYHCTDESLEAYYDFADKFWATHDSTGMKYYSNAKLFDARAPKCKLRESKKLKEAVMTAEEADFHEGDYYKNRFGWVIVIEKIDGDYVQAKQYLDTNPDKVTTRMKSIPTLYDHLINCHFTKLKNIKESKELKEEEDLVRYATLSSLLRKAKNQKVKQTGDHYATVTVKGYAGGPYEIKISYCNSDEGMSPLFYVSFVREDEVDDDFCIGESLYSAIKEKFKSAGYLEEMQAESLYVEQGEIQKLEDIANGQGFLFDEECCSAEFQRMAPTNAMHLFGPSAKIHRKDSLGKKDKYNRLGEGKKSFKEWRANSADEALNWINSELDTLEMNVNILIDNVSARYEDDDEVKNVISAIRDSFNYIRSDCINYKK